MIYWQPPKRAQDWHNSLTDAVAAAEPGALIVYRHARPTITAQPPRINTIAVSVASRLRCALVQFPEGPCGGDQRLERTWSYAIQKPTRAA